MMGVVSAQAAIGDAINRTGWQIVASSSCDDSGSGQPGAIIDGDDGTFWHSYWSGGQNPTGIMTGNLPEWFVIDLGSEQSLGGVSYRPRNGLNNGNCLEYKIFVSSAPFTEQGVNTPITAAADKDVVIALEGAVKTGTFDAWTTVEERKVEFDAAVTGQYVMFVVMTSGGSQPDQWGCCSNFNVYEWSNDYKPVLIEEIAAFQAQVTSAESLIGTNPGQYTQTTIDNAKVAIAAAQGVVDNNASTDSEEEVALNALKEAEEAFAYNPIVSGNYKIVCGYPEYKNQQGNDKAIYANGTKASWANVNDNDLTFYWNLNVADNGTITIKNVATETWIGNMAGDRVVLGETADAVTFNYLGEGQFNIVCGGTYHTGGHSNGAGVSGDIVSWGGSANTASSWKLIAADEELLSNLIEAERAAEQWRSENMATYLKAGKRVSTLEEGKDYVIYNTCMPTNGQDRSGFLYNNGGFSLDKTRSSALVLTENTDWGYVYRIEIVDGGYYLKTQVLDGSGNYKYVAVGGSLSDTPTKFRIEEWSASTVNKGGGDVQSLDGYNIITRDAEITPDNKVWTIANEDGSTCWNGNVATFATWSTAHPYAFYEVEEAKYPVALYASGIDGVGNLATFSAPIATEVPEGTTAYIGAVEGDYVVLTALEAGKSIPANTGVILESTSTSLEMIPTATEAADVTGNELKNTVLGATTAASIAEVNGYILTSYNGVETFCRLNETGYNVDAYKAYIEKSGAGTEVRLMFNDEATGIENAAVELDANAPVYDLSGRQVKSTKSGVYVSKGKKFIVK